jgi:hypothetical protein
MDQEVMLKVGTDQSDSTLLAASDVQHERFTDPGQSGYDPETAMYTDFYNQYGGFDAYSRFFKLMQEDGIQWPSVSGDAQYTGDNDWSAQLSEYVIAYFSLAFGTTTDLTATFVNAGVGKLSATMMNKTTVVAVIKPYTVDPAVIRDIANAHCSIQAALANHLTGDALSAVRQSLQNLQHGNYTHAIATGGSSSSCPTECTWNQNKCVAKW